MLRQTAAGLRAGGPRGPPKGHLRLLATPRGAGGPLERLLPLYGREPTLLAHLVHVSPTLLGA